jgi:hypothetical protein
VNPLASRSHTTFKKRQKEQARREKQLEKAAKRMQRKLERNSPAADDTVAPGVEDMANPAGEPPPTRVNPAESPSIGVA